MTMEVLNLKRLVMGLALCLCSAIALSGCSGGGSGSSVPFYALAVDGIGSTAQFNSPSGITTDGTNLYVADTNNHTIRKITIASNDVTTLAGGTGASGFVDGSGSEARFNSPTGIKSDGTNLYVCDTGNNAIRKVVIATGEVSTLAGSAAGLSGSNDGTGVAARFHHPEGIAISTPDATDLYVADTANNTIRKVVIATGEVTTLAGSAGNSGSTDDIGTAASFNAPKCITATETNLYVTDTNNNSIRMVEIDTGMVSTFAGGASGSDDGTGVAAQFNAPAGITTDNTNLYVADTGNNTIRVVVITSGAVTTLAGSAGVSGYVDNDTGTTARFSSPVGVAVYGTYLCVADTGNSIIRAVVISSSKVVTVAGHIP